MKNKILKKFSGYYLQAKEVNPDHLEVHDYLGQVYESEGNVDDALHHYAVGAQRGSIASLANLGRVMIHRKTSPTNVSNPVLAEAYLLMALQRSQTRDGVSPDERYQVYRNLGWALIAQKRYTDAIGPLETAMTWKNQLLDNTQEGGMNNCFLAYAYEQSGQTGKGNDYWKRCIRYGHPDYIHEYSWLIEIGRSDIAYCVNTQGIVGGYEGKRSTDAWEPCNALLTK